MSERITRDASDEVEGWLATRCGQLVEVALEATISGEYALVMQAEGDLHRFRGGWYLARRYQTHSGWRIGATFIDPTLPEVVRGGSPWARWWAVTLEVMNELGGGGSVESYQRELDVITRALADPTVWVLRELLHACWAGEPATTNSQRESAPMSVAALIEKRQR